MDKMIDISAKLTSERPKLKVAEDRIYEIDDRKNTILKLIKQSSKSNLFVYHNIEHHTVGLVHTIATNFCKVMNGFIHTLIRYAFG